VFLLASAKEHFDQSGDPREAAVGGLAHSGRVIFAAAAVMVAVFFTFALSGPLPPKEMGVILGIAVLLAIAFFLLGLISDLVIPLVFAAILAAIFVPLVDRLERLRVPRWLGAPLVVLLAIGVVSGITWMVVAGLLSQGREILAQVTAGLEEAGSLPGVAELDTDQAVRTLGELVQTLASGLGSVTVLIVGIVTGLFILLFLMKDWQLVTDGTADQLAALLGLPDRVGRQIVSDTVHSFRGYAWGLTIVGLMNGAVVGLGALLLGVPLAGPIAIVTFITSYIPFFGAFFAGAFAVLIALVLVLMTLDLLGESGKILSAPGNGGSTPLRFTNSPSLAIVFMLSLSRK
jgi:predicted PurR-regulated permease PerM